MPRASTPQDALEAFQALEEGNSIPARNQPKFAVGQILSDIKTWKWHKSTQTWYIKQLLKSKGKNATKEILTFLSEASDIEVSIAGIEAYYALPTHWVVNQCYLQNGQSHSGLTWRYKILVKGTVNDKKLCVIPGVWIGEQSIEF